MISLNQAVSAESLTTILPDLMATERMISDRSMRPGDNVVVIQRTGGDVMGMHARWGFVGNWQRCPPDEPPILFKLGDLRGPYSRKKTRYRCLIPSRGCHAGDIRLLSGVLGQHSGQTFALLTDDSGAPLEITPTHAMHWLRGNDFIFDGSQIMVDDKAPD